MFPIDPFDGRCGNWNQTLRGHSGLHCVKTVELHELCRNELCHMQLHNRWEAEGKRLTA